MGHLRRAMVLVGKLSEVFQVTVLLADTVPAILEAPENVEAIFLPGIGIDPDSAVLDATRAGLLKDRIVARRNIMLREFERLRPRVVVIENFPLSQRRLRGEVLPLIERARNGIYGESLVVCVTEGIVVNDAISDKLRVDRAAELLEKYFDIVVVQSDPTFARLEELFYPKNRLSTPFHHTGFVSPERHESEYLESRKQKRILVTAGDGERGGPLFRAAIDAHRMLWPSLPVPMKIITGSRLSDDEWQELQLFADGKPELTLERTVADLRAEMAHSRWSVSQCDYDMAVNVIGTRTTSLFVPCSDDRRREQIVRAQRLVYWGAGRLLLPRHLNGASLANEIHELTRFEPRPYYFDLNGAFNTTHLLSQLVYKNFSAPAPEHRRAGDGQSQ